MTSEERPTDRDAALARLPAAYSLGLRLRAAGLPDELIAECLAMEPQAVGPLLRIGAAKLAAVLDGHDV